MTWQGDASIGASKETVFGTGVTVTKFPEFVDESLQWDPTFVQGAGLRTGSRVVRSARRSLGKQNVTGDITVEACSKGLGWMLAAALGNATSTQRAASGVYQHNFTPLTGDCLDSYTIQKGIPPLVCGGVASAHTFPGCVCTSLDIEATNSEIVTVKTSWVGREVVTATAYAAPSYPTPVELFTFVQGVITIGGSVTAPTTTTLATGGTAAADIVDFSLTWDNALDDLGYNFGGGGKRVRKPVVGMGELKGKVTAEYDSNVLRDAYLNQTDLALTLTFTGATTIGTGSDKPGLQIFIPNIRLEGELPTANGGAPITQSIDFTGFDNLVAASPLTISYVSTDATP